MKFITTTPKTNLDVARERKVQLDRRGAWLFPVNAVAAAVMLPGAAVAVILGASDEAAIALSLGGFLALFPSFIALSNSWDERKKQEAMVLELESNSSEVKAVEA